MTRPDPRTYITVHDGMPDHPKIAGLSDAAFRALVTGWCWCSRYLTDGVMPLEVWSRIGNKRCRDELVRNLNVLPSADGTSVEFHDYLQHQRSRQQVIDLREKRAEAGRKGGKAGSKPATSAKQMLPDLLSKTEAENREQRVTTEVVRDSVSSVPLSNASEPEHRVEDEPRSKPVSVAARKLSKAYTDIVKLADVGKVCAIITNAQHAGFADDKIREALERLAKDGRTVTADTLRIEIESEGKPRLPHGMTVDDRGVTRLASGMPVAGPGWEAY